MAGSPLAQKISRRHSWNAGGFIRKNAAVRSIARNGRVLVRRWQVPTRPFLFVLVRGQEHVTRMSWFAQPGHNFRQVRLGHGGATGGRPINAASNMKKYRAACAGDRWIRIMPNINQPVISEIA